MDKDNALSEEEFCVAMKLVLLRRKGYSLPPGVPLTLRESATSGEALFLPTTHPQPLSPPSEPRRKLGTLQTSHTVADLPVPSPAQTGKLLVDVSEASGSPDNNSWTTNTSQEREEPAVATIISFDDEEELTSDKNTSTSSVRRALSLKQFSPPSFEQDKGGHNPSPPASPFSPPATTETAPIISLQNPSPKVYRFYSQWLLAVSEAHFSTHTLERLLQSLATTCCQGPGMTRNGRTRKGRTRKRRRKKK